MFIVIEGMDGSGKSTIIKRIKERQFYVTFTPGNEIGTIRKYYDGAPLIARTLYYLSSVVYVTKKEIIPNLDSNIVCDRYIVSTIAYHRALAQFYKCCANETKLLSDLIDTLVSNKEIILPDLTIYLEVNQDEIKNRIKKRETNNLTDRLVQKVEFFNLLEKEYKLWLPKYSKEVKIIRNEDWSSLEKIIKEIENLG